MFKRPSTTGLTSTVVVSWGAPQADGWRRPDIGHAIGGEPLRWRWMAKSFCRLGPTSASDSQARHTGGDPTDDMADGWMNE